VLLREAVGRRRWAAVAIGLIGALVILRPGLGALQWGGLLAVAAGTVHGLYYLATRRLKGSAPPLVTLAYTAMLGALAMTAVLPAFWVPPDAADLLLMACIGLIAAFGHFLLIRAFEMAPAAQLAPYTYCEVGFTAAVGYAVFGDFPDPWTWLGILVIVGSGTYIALRERRLAVRV
jgi:drug/metabolite transporter (DMT)-like permease